MARLLVTGPKALFRRREFSSATITYDVITPWAARRIFEAVHWTPSIWWRIESIHVLNPIVKSQVTHGRTSPTQQHLLNVAYAITARFSLTAAAQAHDNVAQHASIFKRRARSGSFHRTPNLGGNEFTATVALLSSDAQPKSMLVGSGEVDLGWMVFDRDAVDRDKVRFFRPMMSDGLIDLTGVDPSALPY